MAENMQDHAMPMYTDDHDALFRQLYEWHMKMVEYHEQLKAEHSERAKNFQNLMVERTKTVEIPNHRNWDEGEPIWSEVMNWRNSEKNSGSDL
jgi:hypothetical protein